MNFDQNKSIGTHWIALCISGDKVSYFDNFWAKYIPKFIYKKFIYKKNIKTNIYRIQANDSIMRRYFSIAFIDFMLEGNHVIWLFKV